jgi:hypothetical protein
MKHGPPKFDPRGGPTIVLDDEEIKTPTVPQRRVKRLVKKRTFLSMLATALSLVGRETVLFSNVDPVTALHAKCEMPQVTRLEQDFSFTSILQPREAQLTS